MGGQFSDVDPVRCQHYAAFASSLDRVHFDAIYWTMFFLVIGSLFVASWSYQWAMVYREKPEHCEDKFRKKLKISLAVSASLFLVSAVMLIMEVYCLLALQFCDGEDLMSLYWSTWTMLQLGSEIAILGIVLAVWHHLYDIRHPLWALALGTPVLVVAGFGHVISLAIGRFFKKAKQRRNSRRQSRDLPCLEKGITTGTVSSSATIKPEQEQLEERGPDFPTREAGNVVYFTMDVGDDESVRRWPSFAGMFDGKAVVRLTALTEALPSTERHANKATTIGPRK
ncbi:hypothetical protein F4778DRAFT_773722 [Xylariomycetidae sp. FL2044]|nr:hypothetical protein F4778DRAFT_773722 [Xylariomycetidae sp. FL2044]